MSTDVEFLGLHRRDEPTRFAFTVVDRVARLDGNLYGGAAIAVSVATAELVTDRTALWMTTQFVSTVGTGTDIDVRVEVLAEGHRTNQVRVTGTSPTGDTVFASLGATGRIDPDGLFGEFERRPAVAPPEESRPWVTPFSGLARAAGLEVPSDWKVTGFGLTIEIREPEVLEHPEPDPGRFCIWVRRQDGEPVTPAVVAYMADVAPMGVSRALGVLAGGASLDNTIRYGQFVDTEWVLLDLRPHLAVGGYGHGVVHAWSEGGHLLATASQTATMREFDAARMAAMLSRPTP